MPRPVLHALEGDAGLLGDLLERAVAAISIEAVAAEIRDVEIDMPVVVEVAGANAQAPLIRKEPGPLCHIFEPPVAEIAVQSVAAASNDTRRILFAGPRR